MLYLDTLRILGYQDICLTMDRGKNRMQEASPPPSVFPLLAIHEYILRAHLADLA